MPKVAVTFACGLYDRMSALYTGEVKPEGIDLNFLAIDEPRQIFDRMGKNLDFDACEMSSSEVFSRLAAGRNEMVCAAGVSLPRLPPWFHHRQPQSGQDAEGSRGQAHRRSALHSDRRGFHPRLAAGRVWGRFVGRALGAGRHQHSALARSEER